MLLLSVFLHLVALTSANGAEPELKPELKRETQKQFYMSRCCAFYALGAGGVASFGITAGFPAALGLIGFGAAGPVAGSVAGAWQATMGGTIAGASLFATLQSVAMAGVGSTAIIGTGLAGGAAMIAFCDKVTELGLCAPLQLVSSKL